MRHPALLFWFVLLPSSLLFCQFPYDTPNLTKGSVICRVTQKSVSKRENKVVEQSVTEVEFSTPLLLSFAYTAEDLPRYADMTKSWGRLPLIVTANNFVRTRGENEPLTSQVPRFPTSVSYERDVWTIDPCNKGEDKLSHSAQEAGSGQIRDPLCGVSLSLEGLKNDTGYYMVKIHVGGGWGKTKDIPLRAKVYKPDQEDPDLKCKWQNVEGEMYYSLNVPTVTQIFLLGTDLPSGYKGMNGRYRYVDDRPDEETITTEEYDFFKIDTTSIFEYLRSLPPFKRFQLAATYRKVSRDTHNPGTSSEFSEMSSLTLNFGEFKNELILSTTNEEDYHEWLPFRKGEEGYMPLQVKAKLESEDSEPADTIHFYLKDVSRYAGYCTNYPVQDRNTQPDYSLDIRFAVNQSDPNIEFIDTTHVKTRKRVTSGTVDIECFDYGGYAKLEAWTSKKNVKGYSKYDQSPYLVLPEDQNKNHIADKWEKDVGVYDKHLGEKEDGDELPKDQKDQGDGYSLFEEYRGFFAVKDFCKENKNVTRSGKFIRTDPNWKDVFFYDATNNVFETQYAPSSPAELNWHLVDDDQMKHVSSNMINSRILKEGDPPVVLLDYLEDNDHRWMNYNSPEEFRVDKHYGLFMLYSDRLAGTGLQGQAMLSGGRTSYVKKCQYIEVQRYASYENATLKNCPYQQTCSNVSQCSYQRLNREPKKTDVCPTCGAAFKVARYYNEQQMRQIAKLTYEGAIIHEIGHGILGPDHHARGVAKFTALNGSVHAISPTNLSALSGEDLENAKDVLAELGVPSCAIRYNYRRDEEFTGGSLLNTRTNRYCRKDETYLDDYGNPQKADNCFGRITVK